MRLLLASFSDKLFHGAVVSKSSSFVQVG